jgi:hypothetical protein
MDKAADDVKTQHMELNQNRQKLSEDRKALEDKYAQKAEALQTQKISKEILLFPCSFRIFSVFFLFILSSRMLVFY